MRVPYICRPCLAHLQRTSSPILKPFRTALHTATAEYQDHVVERPNYREVLASYQDESRRAERPVEPRRPGSRRKSNQARSRGGFSKIQPRSFAQKELQDRVLELRTNLRILQSQIAAVYGLPGAAASDAVGQLERLLSVDHVDATDAYTAFATWKLEYARALRQNFAASKDISTSQGADRAVFPERWDTSVDALRASWDELDQSKRRFLWPRMIQSILKIDYEVLPSFLQATYNPAWSPFYVVEDTVRLLASRARTSTSSTTEQEALIELFTYLSKADYSQSFQLGHDIAGAIIASASLPQAIGLFYCLNTDGKPMKKHTLLQFASKFAKNNESKGLATGIICSMSNMRGFDINSPAASSVCTSLLHLSKKGEVPHGPAAPDELFRQLLEAGLRPNLLNITAMMKNFCLRGHLDTAWTVFDLLVEYGIKPDSHVYSTLLDASKQDLDYLSIRRVMASIHVDGAWSPVILNDFLQVIFMESEGQADQRRRQKKDNNAFRHMLHVYFKFFKLEPLQKLLDFSLDDYLVWQGPAPGKATLITDLAAALLPLPESKLMKPDTITLSLMLSAAMRGAPRFYTSRKNGPVSMLAQINHFNKLFDSGDASAVALVEEQGTLIYDVFLRGMLQFKELLHPACELVKNMLERARTEERRCQKNIRYPRPSVHTWTMLVNGFKNHRQPGIAASMVRMMIKEGGVKPNMVTWNTLIRAFARVGEVYGAVRSLRYLEQSGLRPDKHTIHAISSMYPEARKRALSLMEDKTKNLIPVDDDLAPLLATPIPKKSGNLNPATKQQHTNSDVVELSREELLEEMERLALDSDALSAEYQDSYVEDEAPWPIPTPAHP